MSHILLQRAEAGLIAAATLAAMVVFGQGWLWPLALFLVFDLSMLGYLAGPRIGAVAYNLVHSWFGAAACALITLALTLGQHGGPHWLIIVTASWAFHVGVDRMLGYGLKLPAGFGHTHLGLIGKAKREAAAADSDGA